MEVGVVEHAMMISLDASKDPQWNSEEGNLRIYLRGRPVSLYAPSDLSDYSVDKEVTTPDQKLQLEYVFGYRGRDCRSNLYYLNGEVIYFCAGVVVLHNPEEQTQRHYLGHTDDVLKVISDQHLTNILDHLDKVIYDKSDSFDFGDP